MLDKSRTQSDSERFSARLDLAAYLSFAGGIILIPFRLGILLISRPEPPIYSGYTDFFLFASDIALLLMFAFWIASLSVSPRRLEFGPRHIWMPLLGLTLAGCVSIITSFDPWLSAYHSLRLIALFWFYVFIVNEIHSMAMVVIPVGLQIGIQSVVAVGQFIGQHSLNLQAVGELFINPASSGASVVIANGVRLLRAYGLTDHPNILGGCLAFGLVIVLAAYLHRQNRLAPLVVFLVGLAALLATFSRSAWLAFLGAAALMIGATLVSRRESLRQLPRMAVLSLLLLAPFVFVFSSFLGARLNANGSFTTPSVEQQAIGERLLLVDLYLPVLLKHLWLGVGLGVAPRALQVYYPAFTLNYEPPHLALMNAALETGLFGALCCLSLMISPFLVFFRRRDLLLRSLEPVVAIALLFAVTIVGFFDYYTWLLQPGRLWQWLAWGLWAVAITHTRRPSPAQQPLAVHERN